MKQRFFILLCLLAPVLRAQDHQPQAVSSAASPEFRVLQRTVVRQPDGGTVTFKPVEPPPPGAVQPQPVPVLSAEEMALIQRLEAKEQRTVSVSATVHAVGSSRCGRCAM